MRNRQLDPLNDALAREIEGALAVEPSPEFEARVRQRVAPLSPRAPAMGRWSLAAAGGLGVLVMVWLAAGGSERGRDDLPFTDRRQVASAVMTSAPPVEEGVSREQKSPEPARKRNPRPSTPRQITNVASQPVALRAVVISPYESAAVDRLLAVLRSPNVVFVGADELLLDPVQPQQPDPLGIAAIDVPPLEIFPVQEAE